MTGYKPHRTLRFSKLGELPSVSKKDRSRNAEDSPRRHRTNTRHNGYALPSRRRSSARSPDQNSDENALYTAPTKKSKKETNSINSRLALVMKSGKYVLGYKSTLKTLRSGKAKLVIIAGMSLYARRILQELAPNNLQATPPRSASLSSSTTPCWASATFTTSLATTYVLPFLLHALFDIAGDDRPPPVGHLLP